MTNFLHKIDEFIFDILSTLVTDYSYYGFKNTLKQNRYFKNAFNYDLSNKSYKTRQYIAAHNYADTLAYNLFGKSTYWQLDDYQKEVVKSKVRPFMLHHYY